MKIEQKYNVRQFVRTALYLGIITFIAENVGSMSHELSNLISLCLFILFGMSYLPGVVKAEANIRFIHGIPASWNKLLQRRFWSTVYLLLLLGSSASIITQKGYLKFGGLFLFVIVSDLVFKKVKHLHREFSAFLLTLFLYVLFLLFYDHMSYIWFYFMKSNEVLFKIIGNIIHENINIGNQYSGLKIEALFALYYLSTFVLSKRGKVLVLIFTICALFVAHIIYIVAWANLAGSHFFLPLDMANPLPQHDIRFLLFLFLLVPTFFMIKAYQPQIIPIAIDRKVFMSSIWAALGFTISILLLTIQITGEIITKDIVIYDSGYLNRTLPVFDQYGFERIGMFGLFPEYLKSRNYSVRIIDTITSETLKNAGVLVLINLNRSFGEETKATIWNFIETGGSLLVLGDHTGQEQIGIPFNDLLKRVNISFNFDSAIPLNSRWVNGYELKTHPILSGISEDEIQIGVGASLAIVPPARPIILGMNGFSDKGNLSNPQRGYLGDMRFTKDEQLGDLVLVAEAYHGKGKVLVFGDTSSLQNGAIVHSYKFIDNIFQWLSGNGNRFYNFRSLLSLVVLSAFLVHLLLTINKNATPLMGHTLLLLLILQFSPAYSSLKASSSWRPDTKIANIDISHMERFSLDASQPIGADGLAINLLRNGYIPLYIREFSTSNIDNSKVLAIIAPAVPFKQNEIHTIRKFVDSGGLLLLSVGWKEHAASTLLLQEFGIEIVNIPLGRAQTPQGVSLWNAWPLKYKIDGNNAVLVKVWDYPVIVYRHYGNGGVVAIGDSSFFLNNNLEGVYNFDAGNIMFLKDCLQRFNKGLFIYE